MKTFKEVLKEEEKKEIDTDYGILRAQWKTLKILIDEKNAKEAMKMAQYIGKQWGQFKFIEARGDVIDAGLWPK